jgi:tRNA A37 methylthiotransferase MiaB
MSALGKELSRAYREPFLGSAQDVLFEKKGKDGLAFGHTPQYMEVRAAGGIPGHIQKVRLQSLRGEGFEGTVITEPQV